MKVLNDSLSSPLRFVLNDGRIFGQMYNSWDKKYHLAEYIPYKVPPDSYICNALGNMSPSRETNDRNICSTCFCSLIDFTGKK